MCAIYSIYKVLEVPCGIGDRGSRGMAHKGKSNLRSTPTDMAGHSIVERQRQQTKRTLKIGAYLDFHHGLHLEVRKFL